MTLEHNMRILFFMICLVVSNFCLAKFEDPRPPFFTIDQEQQLADQPEAFAYFSELYVYRKNPEQIAKDHNLSKEESLAFLKKLVDIKIIKPLPDLKNLPDKVEFLVSGVTHFRENGAPSRKFDELSIDEYFGKLKEELRNGSVKPSTTGFWITDDQHQAFLKELYELDQKYVALSLENRKTGNKDAHRVSMLRALIPNWEQSFFKKVKVENLKRRNI